MKRSFSHFHVVFEYTLNKKEAYLGYSLEEVFIKYYILDKFIVTISLKNSIYVLEMISNEFEQNMKISDHRLTFDRHGMLKTIPSAIP